MSRVEYSSDADLSDGEHDDDSDFVLDHNWDILSRGNHALGLSKSYVPRWTPSHAIREFYQNW